MRTNEGPQIKGTRDQILVNEDGRMTMNGVFAKAFAESPGRERIRVYEKVMTNVWEYRGLFRLVNCRQEHDGVRTIWIFDLDLLDADDESEETISQTASPGRLIPSAIKKAVWARDRGRCVLCDRKSDLQFDHIIPHARGGSSLTAQNVQLLCRECNLRKSDAIE